MSGTDKLLRAFIEANGYEVAPIVSPKLVGNLFGEDVVHNIIIDYKVTKSKLQQELEDNLAMKPNKRNDKEADLRLVVSIINKWNLSLVDLDEEIAGIR